MDALAGHPVLVLPELLTRLARDERQRPVVRGWAAPRGGRPGS